MGGGRGFEGVMENSSRSLKGPLDVFHEVMKDQAIGNLKALQSLVQFFGLH